MIGPLMSSASISNSNIRFLDDEEVALIAKEEEREKRRERRQRQGFANKAGPTVLGSFPVREEEEEDIEVELYAPIIIESEATDFTGFDRGQLHRLAENDLAQRSVFPLLHWRCGWCYVDGSRTPAWRRGPMGENTLCDLCGIFAESGKLDERRYKLHEEQ